MSVLFQDPKKYQELVERIKEEEKLVLLESINSFKNLSEYEITEFLKTLGDILHLVRLNNNITLKDFVKNNLYEDTNPALKTSEIERGIRLPSSKILKNYLKILTDNGHD